MHPFYWKMVTRRSPSNGEALNGISLARMLTQKVAHLEEKDGSDKLWKMFHRTLVKSAWSMARSHALPSIRAYCGLQWRQKRLERRG